MPDQPHTEFQIQLVNGISDQYFPKRDTKCLEWIVNLQGVE